MNLYWIEKTKESQTVEKEGGREITEEKGDREKSRVKIKRIH